MSPVVMQRRPTVRALRADRPDGLRVAAACGFARTATAATVAEVAALAPRLAAGAGQGLIRLVVGAVTLPKSLPTRDGAQRKARFRAHRGLAPL